MGEEGQLVEGGEEVEELGPGRQVLAQVVRVEITEALDHKVISYTYLYRESDREVARDESAPIENC